MKKNMVLGAILVIFLTLLGCKGPIYSPTQFNSCLLNENWMQTVNTNPSKWLKNVDSWFITGQPNQTERANLRAPDAAAISYMSVRVPYFSNLKVEGDFQVQIVGNQATTSAYVVGPNTLVNDVVVEVNNQTVFIHPRKDSKANLSKVIVRLGVRDLQSITNAGTGTILGRHIVSIGLKITNCASGCIILNGDMNVTKVIQSGSGTITVMGACAPCVQVEVKTNGNVNLSGHVGIQKIIHLGDGQVNIIGADTDSLSIEASGCGLTSVVGYAQLKKVTAKNSSQVYVYWVTGQGAYICASDSAIIGLAGSAANMNIDAYNNSRFWGQYLRGGTVYVRTEEYAHANVNVVCRLFAAATNYSSIYFFGTPTVVSRYTTQNGVVLPVWSKSSLLATPQPAAPVVVQKPAAPVRKTGWLQIFSHPLS